MKAHHNVYQFPVASFQKKADNEDMSNTAFEQALKNENRFARVETDIAVLKSDVSTLKDDMKEVKADIKSLRSSFDRLEGSLKVCLYVGLAFFGFIATVVGFAFKKYMGL
jgi:septal ring factor EnvC (AmiA/AmiB activator)